MDIIASARVSDLPHPPIECKRTVCIVCKEHIWLTELVYEQMVNGAHVPMCLQCVRERVNDTTEPIDFQLLPGQLAEIERALGTKVATDIEKMVERMQKDADEIRRQKGGPHVYGQN